jgi:hypothetical protein
MHASVYDYVTMALGREEVEGKDVLEVGALDVNGSVRPYVTSLKPRSYIGIDKRKGRRVDLTIAAEELTQWCSEWVPHVTICTETLEHIRPWRIALWNMVERLRIGGMLVLTTRSPGFPRHDHPDDYWRFDLREWRAPCIPWQLVDVRSDPEVPGMFLTVRKTGPVPMHLLDTIRATRAPQ